MCISFPFLLSAVPGIHRGECIAIADVRMRDERHEFTHLPLEILSTQIKSYFDTLEVFVATIENRFLFSFGIETGM